MAKTKDNTTMVSRPRRKPDSSVRGKLNRWDNSDYCEFVPAGTRESNRLEIKRVGDSSFYKTSGQKESSYSLHVNVDGDSQDPVAEIYEIMDVLTKDQRKQLPKLPESSEGRMLLDDGNGLQVWLDRERGKVSILTELDCNGNIERMLLQAQASMNVCIGRHRSEILKYEPNK